MALDYTEGGTVKVRIIDYIDEIIYVFDKVYPRGRDINASAVLEDLYNIDEDRKKLSPDKDNMFHNIVATTLYTNKWARPDTCTEVASLATIFREPNKYEWSKIIHLMKYIRGTGDIPLVLSTNRSGFLNWWIDASYAVHPNMWGHTGG